MLEDRHPSVYFTSEVVEIAQPLFESTNFHFFSYFRHYPDGSRILLSTNSIWTQYLYSQKYASINQFNIGKSPMSSTPGAYLWEWLPNLLETELEREGFYKKIKDGYKFGLHNGISIIKDLEDSKEYFNFGTKEDSSYVYQFLFNRLNILERFVIFFKIKAKSLLEKCELHKIILPSYSTLIAPNPSQKNDFLKSDFINQTAIDQFPCLVNNQTYILSKRQIQCLYYLSQGKSAKEIAQFLNISNRSVEKYIQLVKEKFLVSTKSQLLTLCDQTEIKNYFVYCVDN